MSDLQTKCEICKSLIDEEDLFCSNCGTEAPRPEVAEAEDVDPEGVLSEGAAADRSRLATHNFECSGCGASMSFDVKAGALRCPFCDSLDMVAKKDAKILAPRSVVPFRLDQEQALQTMRRWLGKGFFRPSDLSQRAAVVKMQPVYVPYWVFKATTHTHWTADTSQAPGGARSNWYPLAGEHRGHYDKLLVGASGVLTPSEMATLRPYDLSQKVAPEEVDLENVTVEQFAMPRKYARPLARNSLEHDEKEACDARYVPGRSRNVHVNVRVASMSSEPILLPVWIMAYHYKGRPFRFLVNGQSGKAAGAAPISWLKIMIVGAIALILLALLAGVASANLAHGNDGRGTSLCGIADCGQRPAIRRVTIATETVSACWARGQRSSGLPLPPRCGLRTSMAHDCDGELQDVDSCGLSPLWQSGYV